MKFKRIISLIIIAIIVLAFLTNPKEADWYNFVRLQVADLQSAPMIGYKNNLIYSSASITFFSPATEKGKLVATANKEEYIGLFGKFWRLKQ